MKHFKLWIISVLFLFSGGGMVYFTGFSTSTLFFGYALPSNPAALFRQTFLGNIVIGLTTLFLSVFMMTMYFGEGRNEITIN